VATTSAGFDRGPEDRRAAQPSGSHDFARRVRDGRRALNLTQEELAARAGIGVRTVRTVEAGRSVPRPDTVRRITAALEPERVSSGNGTAGGVNPVEAVLHGTLELVERDASSARRGRQARPRRVAAGGRVPRMVATMSRTRRVAATSWARNTLAPSQAETAVAASVPSSRSPSGRSRV
jgi:transcriptional regulator with XRE-family HTH domain